MVRTVCKNTCHDRLSSSERQPYGHPRITVFGFNPPKPVVWTLFVFVMQKQARREKIFVSQNKIYFFQFVLASRKKNETRGRKMI